MCVCACVCVYKGKILKNHLIPFPCLFHEKKKKRPTTVKQIQQLQTRSSSATCWSGWLKQNTTIKHSSKNSSNWLKGFYFIFPFIFNSFCFTPISNLFLGLLHSRSQRRAAARCGCQTPALQSRLCCGDNRDAIVV